MRKTILILFCMIFLINGISALIDLGTAKQGECVELYQSCPTCTYSIVRECKYPNETIINVDWSMDKSNSGYTYDFCDTEVLGDYSCTIYGNKGGLSYESPEEEIFRVTPNGEEMDTSTSLLYGFFLTLIGIFLFFAIMGIRKAVGAWMIFYLCLTYVLIYAIVGIGYLLARDYLWAAPIFAKILYLSWFVLGIGFLPFAIIISLYILKQESRAVLESNYLKQGYTPDEARELSRRHKL